MDGSEWSVLYKWVVLGEESCDGIYLGYLNLFFELHIWEYTRKCLSKHRLTASWRSLKEDIVPTSSSYEEGSLSMFLPDYM